MLRYLVISACAFAVILCKPSKRQEFGSDEFKNDDFGNNSFGNDFFGAESNVFENLEAQSAARIRVKDRNSGIEPRHAGGTGSGGQGGGDGGGGGTSAGGLPTGDGKIGYSAGSGLRSIAQGSAEQAHTAVQNQDAAGHQAAYVAKNTLAQAASAASATAQAALAGKQIILQGIEQQYRDAQVALQGEKDQLQQAQRSAVAAQQTSQQAQRHVLILTAALNVAQATADGAGQTASEAAGELAAQIAMVGSAQQRLDQLAEQLHGIRIDFDATQIAAQKAQLAAQQAQANAAQAAAAAAAASGVHNPPQDDGSNQGGVLNVPPQGQGHYISADYQF